jgi:hypothetical protein
MKMLFAKINPVAQIPEMETPFENDVKTANYLTAVASPYRLGSTEVNFSLIYGSATFDADGKMETFTRLLGGSIVLTSPDIEEWGIDDSVILGTICEKVGTEAVEFIEGDPNNFNPF